jgi:hypothetical protein
MRNKDIFGTPIRFKRQVQNTDLYRNQRAQALMRAGYKCEVCRAAKGEKGSNGQIIKSFDLHHLIAFEEIIAKYNIKTLDDARLCPILWDVTKVQILCHGCHAKTDSYGTGKEK